MKQTKSQRSAKKTRRNTNLRRRESVDPPHCRWAGCGRQLPKDQLLEHWRQTHSELYRTPDPDPKQTVPCLWQNCTKRFRSGSYSAEAHMRGHLAREFSWKEFGCPACYVRFTRRPDLTAHIKKQHSVRETSLNTPPGTPNPARIASILSSPIDSPTGIDTVAPVHPLSNSMMSQVTTSEIDSDSQVSLLEPIPQSQPNVLYSQLSPIFTDLAIVTPPCGQREAGDLILNFPNLGGVHVPAAVPDSPKGITRRLPDISVPDPSASRTVQPYEIFSGPDTEKLLSSPVDTNEEWIQEFDKEATANVIWAMLNSPMLENTMMLETPL